MAIEVFPDSPNSGMSPRISFSHDLSQTEIVPIEQYIRSGNSSSSIDFDFCVFRGNFDQESTTADELFFAGKILPIEIKKKLSPPRKPPPAPLPPPSPAPAPAANFTSKNFNEPEEKQQNYKSSFWSFKRSTSLNCGSGYARTLCPLPLLSRSNSTGSTASAKRSSISNNQKSKMSHFSSSSSSSSSHQKPPLKKSQFSHYTNGVKISPVLNVPHANLFGLGSIFSGLKDKSKKKY